MALSREKLALRLVEQAKQELHRCGDYLLLENLQSSIEQLPAVTQA